MGYIPFKNKIYKFLKSLENFFQTDMIYLVKNTSWLTGGKLVDIATSLVTGILFANFLPKNLYGSYKYVMSVAGMFSIFTLTGLNNSLIRSVSRGFEGTLTKVFKVRLKWGNIATLLILGVSSYYYIQDNLVLSYALLAASLVVPLKQVTGVFRKFLRGKDRFDLEAKYSAITQIIVTLFVAVSIYLTNKVWLIIAVYVGGAALFNLFFYYWVNINYKENDKKEKGAVSYGKHLSVIGVINTIFGKLEDIIVWHFLGAVPLAVYSFAKKPPVEIRGLFFSALTKIALPKFSSKDYQTLKETLTEKVFKSYIFIVPAVVGYIILAPYLYRFIFPQYMDSVLLSQVFVLTLLFKPRVFFNQALTAHKKKKAKYISSSSGPIKIVLLLILIPFYGIWALVYTQLVVSMFDFVLQYYLFKRM